jgi:hypothetical protein
MGLFNDKSDDKRITYDLEWIARELTDISSSLRQLVSVVVKMQAATGFKISQKGAAMITGIQKGAVGQFVAVTDPPGSALQPGSVPVWSADDPLVSMTPSADGMSVAVQTSAGDTATSFNLTLTGVNSAGSTISTKVNVPLIPAAQVPAGGFLINQTS